MKAMTSRSDAQLQTDVQNELRMDTRVHVTDIGVTVRDGIVTLTGSVDSWSKSYAAQQAAHRVAGVMDVANDITVRATGSMERSDADLAAAARQALEWDVRVPERNIQTSVSRGVITLEGSVNFWSERADAEEAVRNLVGVRGVTNLISVAPSRTNAAEVRKAVADALARQAQGEAERFDVQLHDGRVTLAGSVHSWAERLAALGAAGAIPGVRGVTDNLRISA